MLNIKIDIPKKQVIHLIFDTRFHLCSTFMRLSEYKESPYKDVCNKFFTYEDYMEIYVQNSASKKFKYFEDWSGYNIPSEDFKEFIKIFKCSLWKREKELINVVNDVIKKYKWKEYYIIGSAKNNNHNVIKHELAHAYWMLYPKYRKGMRVLLKNYNKKDKKHLIKCLKNIGYNDNVMEDELQAYLSTSTKGYLINEIKTKDSFKIPIKFVNYFKEFNKGVL